MAAKKSELGAVHSALTKVFIRVLERYIANLDELDKMPSINEAVEDEIMAAVMPENLMPNPAMLGAVAKFLKDNEIRFDDEETDKLSKLERSLAEKRKVRDNVVSLTTLKAVGDE